jgi:alpha-mannosidase
VVQPLKETTGVELTESPLHYPDADKVRLTRLLAWVDDVGAYGTRSLRAGQHGVEEAPNVPTLPSHVAAATDGDQHIENGLLRIEWTARGDVRVIGSDGRRIARLLRLEDQDDRGDLYTPSPRGAVRVAKFVDARITRRGPLRAEVTTQWRVAEDTPIRVRLSLDAGARWIRIRVGGGNKRVDHRLRLVIGTGVSAGEVWADAAFGPVRRTPLVVPAADSAAELPPPTAPLQRYVALFAGEQGATLISDGLAEYEAREDGTIAVTLMRAVGELSRDDLPERPGHAGWPSHVPAAQAKGPFKAAFALLLHGARSAATLDEIERTTDDVLLPLRGRSLRSALEIHAPTAGVELHGEGLAFSTCKLSENDQWVVLRCVNFTDERRVGEWRLGWTPSDIRLSRLDETPGEALTADGSVVGITAEPRAAITILAR